MNGTSGFQEVRSSTSRSSANRLLHEQRHQFETGFWHLPYIHNHTALFTRVSTKLAKVPHTIFRAENQRFRISSKWGSEGNRNA